MLWKDLFQDLWREHRRELLQELVWNFPSFKEIALNSVCFWIIKTCYKKLLNFFFTNSSSSILPPSLPPRPIKKKSQRQETHCKRVAFTIMHFKNDMKNLPQTEWIELRQKQKGEEKERKNHLEQQRRRRQNDEMGEKTRFEMKTVKWDFCWWCFDCVL